ncbi:MAG: hypothetical protein ACLFO6_04270 [Archaeoglobaceae archaeon]
MNIRSLIVVILVVLLLAGCTQQKDTQEPSGSDEQVTATPQETENGTEPGEDQPEESVSDVDDLESNISEVEDLIKDLEETDEIDFSI